jgi:cytidyltransferase-like protein
MSGAVAGLAKNGARRVMAMGVFDLFHVGHLRYLQAARAHGTQLVVAVSPDQMVADVKGKRPVVPQEQRLELVRALACVDGADLQPVSSEASAEAAAWIAAWRVDHVVVGGDWAGSARWQRLGAALATFGIGVSFAPPTAGVSTTLTVAAIRARAAPA